MALMDEAVWRGKIYSGGWVAGAGGDTAYRTFGHSSPRRRHLAGERG